MGPATPLRRRTRARPAATRAEGGSGGDGDDDDVRCEACGSGESAAELLLCDGCDRGLHIFCLRPILPRVPAGDWFCPSCASPSPHSKKSHAAKKPKQFPLVQTKIVDFFKIQRGPAAALAAAAESSEGKKRKRKVLPKEDVETLNLCKRMMARGEWPPLLVVYDPVEGFTVEADRFIKDLTIITEYVGDVDYLTRREHDDGDSMMTLLSAATPSRSLVICPDKRSNIARFINGINNHTPDGRKKQNLKCVRFDVGGECRVLLVANRDISKGERLYYDYNGSEHEYPTHHFV
ncbi:Os02g0122700 [Oryza sativa Japonica Group]|uniref:Os02g0122700 protein n=1 Tax=Oryza sativa subsp. japonica TaxID=39947 RepID=A0A0P0VE60_ORYSJ|nr:hypothetical protein EE612_008549 [Oryza sativa]BAS76724.1 Os02g0122700 [Oryza sativa Japonica Group]